MRPEEPGTAQARAGRLMPRMRPMPSVAAANTAPVEPAEKKPSASPARTAPSPRTMLESRLARTASVGCSDMPMDWVVTRARARS